jgi:hypothetical protein
LADWQRGYPLEQLQAFAAPFKARHKALVFGAFGLTKERDVAEYLARGRAIWTGNPPEAIALFSIAKVASEQHDFAQRQFKVQPGSVSVKAFAASTPAAGAKLLSALRERSKGAPIWLEIFEEDQTARAALTAAGGFNYVTTKILAGSEIKGLYFTGAPPLPQLEPADEATLLVVDPEFLAPAEHAAIKAEIAQFSNLWAQHYSSYNKRKSWEAFALRGYDDEPGFIIKPAEMAKSWKEENAARLADKPRATKAAEHFPATLQFCTRLVPLEQADRIRFMRLRSKGGELTRHADITDREAGTADGAIARMHIPIITSSAVRFRGWTARGDRLETAFPERALCYLDQRKPHAVTNSDPTLDRVHLVVDCIASAALRRQLEAALPLQMAA